MVKQTIQIFARVKPSRKQSGIYSVEDEEPSSSVLEIIIPRELADGFVNNKRESYKFKFQKAFDQEAKQESVFDSIARPVAESVLAGYNGTIFAYGQTGSGKTFTITGGAERYNDRGIIPRTLSYIFEQLQKDSSKIYTTYISYLEIYNECGYDLLDHRHEASRLEDLPKVTIMEDTDQNIHLKNLSLQQATNEEEALNLLFLGDTNRMIAETPMNQASTRSHCIFTIHISSKEPGSATVRRSKLHLVDLAGSERVAKSGVGGLLLTEAKYINLSLHYLEQVIIALAERNRAHIPYRNSMMTSVLRDSLGGNCMTTMIATLSLDKRNIDESISTCRFAQRVALIKNEAVLNEEADPRLMIARLKKEIQALKDELAMVTGEQRTEELTQEELLKLEELMKVFLEDTDPECTLDVGADMRKIQHCFKNLKDLLNRRVTQDNQLISPESLEEKPVLGPGVKEEIQKLRELLHQRDSEINILVSMLKKEKKRAQDALLKAKGFASYSHTLAESGQRPPTPSQLHEMSDGDTLGQKPGFLHQKSVTRRRCSKAKILQNLSCCPIFKNTSTMDIHDPKSHESDGQAAAAAATASAAGSGAGDGEDPLECSSDNEFTLSDKSLSGTDSDTDSTIVYLYRSQTPAATSTSLQSPSSQRREEEEACSDPREEITDWCACGKCIPTSNILNCKCCLDFQEIQDRVLKFCKGYGDGKKIRCITQHDGFRSLCLDPWVLETAYYQYRQEYPYDAESAQDQAQKYRNIAYRQFVRWTFGWLGRHKRVLLPSCVMKAIRDSFPNEDGTYAGFKYE